ncbi:hypothetical protein JKP88DRAFT_272394 [Tribonema minus]|uniref:Uncharacterized protein n=1 Tax=Tribonema minus TaxID=303371 RepID=A0A836CRN3_9STRA|nr:hypothetical protein JKP88DRAFT_272394 [Tribonema minus]
MAQEKSKVFAAVFPSPAQAREAQERELKRTMELVNASRSMTRVVVARLEHQDKVERDAWAAYKKREGGAAAPEGNALREIVAALRALLGDPPLPPPPPPPLPPPPCLKSARPSRLPSLQRCITPTAPVAETAHTVTPLMAATAAAQKARQLKALMKRYQLACVRRIPWDRSGIDEPARVRRQACGDATRRCEKDCAQAANRVEQRQPLSTSAPARALAAAA